MRTHLSRIFIMVLFIMVCIDIMSMKADASELYESEVNGVTYDSYEVTYELYLYTMLCWAQGYEDRVDEYDSTITEEEWEDEFEDALHEKFYVSRKESKPMYDAYMDVLNYYIYDEDIDEESLPLLSSLMNEH